MLLRWPSLRNSTTSTDSPASFPRLESGASSATPGPWSSPSGAAEKNDLRHLRASVLDLLRPAAPACPRSLLWRPACLPRLLPAPRPMFGVRRREERTTRLARRQPPVHQTVRLL